MVIKLKARSIEKAHCLRVNRYYELLVGLVSTLCIIPRETMMCTAFRPPRSPLVRGQGSNECLGIVDAAISMELMVLRVRVI